MPSKLRAVCPETRLQCTLPYRYIPVVNISILNAIKTPTVQRTISVQHNVGGHKHMSIHSMSHLMLAYLLRLACIAIPLHSGREYFDTQAGKFANDTLHVIS
jgi:hypothetical protein